MKLTLIEPRYDGYYTWEADNQLPGRRAFINVQKKVFWSVGLLRHKCLMESTEIEGYDDDREAGWG